MPYDETIIEGIPECYTNWGFNHSEFKPTLPKWWQNMSSECWSCGKEYMLRDVSVRDPFVDLKKFCGPEFFVRHNCPNCGTEGLTRMLFCKVMEDQINKHINKQSTKK